MRKNSVRKFIHAILDLLPLFVIPIFAININQKSVEPIQVEVQENYKLNNFNQLITPNWSNLRNNYKFSFEKTTNSTQWYNQGNFSFDLTLNHVYYLKITDSVTSGSWNNSYWLIGGNGPVIYSEQYPNGNVVTLLNNRDNNIGFVATADVPLNTTYEGYLNLIDLTNIYGVGNEPTLLEASIIFNETYYNYTLNSTILIEGQIITYNDTDIGSQFLYSLYSPVHDYFNFNNLFNMGAIYDWIQLNLFSGTAPLPVFIIWNIIVYEFFVDLLFLLYSVFMFVIDFTTNTIDSFVNKSRRL